MDELSEIKDDVRAIRQALLGFNGHGGLLKQVERLEKRVGKLEQWRWTTEGLRGILAATVSFLTALLTGRQG